MGSRLMMKEGNTAVSALWRDLFSTGFYKKSQGRIARQATAAVLGIVVLLAAFSLYSYMSDKVLPLTNLLLVAAPENATPEQLEEVHRREGLYNTVNGYGRYAVPLVVILGGGWLAFRAVNIPQFADFLIAVEAEMNKVSWPTRQEMFRSAVVVIITIFGLAFVLFGYDFLWQFLLRMLGVLG